LKVLSLFDGISCGMVALERAGIPVEEYHAYEIDKYAIQVSEKNYPQIVHHGNVFEGDFTQYKGFGLLVGGSPCFTKGHLVLTDKGYKDISEICVGDMVLTHENRYKPVVKTYVHSAETVDLKIAGYPWFRTTPNHPFLAKTKSKKTYAEYKGTSGWRKFSDTDWVKVEDMTTDTFCSMHIKETGIQPVSLDNQILWLLGRYIADGHITKYKRKNRKNSYQYRLTISVGNDKLEHFKSVITDYHFCCCPHTQSTYRCVFCSMELVNYVLEQNFGCCAVEKRIPDLFMRLPDEQAKIFLDGYLSGDAYYGATENRYYATTVSKELAFQLQRLISRVYQTNVSVEKHDNSRKNHYINGREIKSNYPLYTIVFKKHFPKQAQAYIAEDKCWTSFKQCVPTNKTETVYNIEVADDHSYTVNNCIVHNCTTWSIAKRERETTPDGAGGQLFMQYVRALRESGCKYFLYENNNSIHKDIKDFISEQLGVQPIMINSALVSAQQRKRCYWTNIPNVTQPVDKGILMKDILESGQSWVDKSYCLTASYDGAIFWNTLQRKQRTMVAEPIRLGHIGKSNGQTNRVYSIEGKSVCLQAQAGGGGAKTGLYKIDLPDGDYTVRKLTPVEAERLQTLPDNYTEGISKAQRYKCIGNGWTVDVIAHILSFIPEEDK